MGATDLVKKEAPNKLLLGTDVQPTLGFALVMETTEMFDLLSGKKCKRRDRDVAAEYPIAQDGQPERCVKPAQPVPNRATTDQCSLLDCCRP